MAPPVYSLMYHDVVAAGQFRSSGIQGADADLYKVEHGKFRRQLDAVAGLNRPGTGRSIRNETDSSAVYFTFDDGGASGMWIAEELDRRGWKGHFFVVSDWIGHAGFLTASDIRDLAARGHIIGSHSQSHPPRLSGLPADSILLQWRESIAALSQTVGSNVDVASVPGGFYSSHVGRAAEQAGIRYLFTSEPTAYPRLCGSTWLLGRYHIQRDMSCDHILSFAGAADASHRRRQALIWKVKQLFKTIGGDFYVAARKHFIR